MDNFRKHLDTKCVLCYTINRREAINLYWIEMSYYRYPKWENQLGRYVYEYIENIWE